MGGLEDLHLRFVLGANDHAVLELLGEGVQMFGVVSLGTCDVNADDGLLVVQVGHILDLALEDDSFVLQNQVLCQPGLAFVALGVGDPEDLAVVGGEDKEIQNLLLPDPGHKIRIFGSFLQLLGEGF